MKNTIRSAAVLLLLLLAACNNEYSRKGNTVTIRVADAAEGAPQRICLQVLGDRIIRIAGQAGNDALRHARPDRASLVVLPQKGRTRFKVSSEGGTMTVSTAEISACVSPEGLISFYDKEGNALLENGSIDLSPKVVEGKQGYEVRTVFDSPEGESFYGLGQHQTGEFDRRGTDEELYQYNTKISIPFVVSTNGYGLLFDAYSYSRWGNPKGYVQLGRELKLYDRSGNPGGLTGTYVAKDGSRLVRREDSLFFENEWAIRNLPDFPLNGAKVTYEGWVEAPRTGDYRFSQYYAGFQRTLFGGKEVMSRRWRPAWNPNSCRFSVHLEAGVVVCGEINNSPLWRPGG